MDLFSAGYLCGALSMFAVCLSGYLIRRHRASININVQRKRFRPAPVPVHTWEMTRTEERTPPE